MKRVLITGGTGFIGANLVYRLLDLNAEIHLIVRDSANLWRIEPLRQKIHIHRGDLCDLDRLSFIVREVKPDWIFHLACYGSSVLHTERELIFQGNVIGTFNLMSAALQTNFEALIHVGSSTEYGHKNEPLQETHMLEPVTWHGATKACAAILAQQIAKKEKCPIMIARLFSIYGPYESHLRLIPTAIRAAIENTPLNLTAAPCPRDYLFVEDAVDALIHCARNVKVGEIVHFGTGTQTANDEVVHLIEELTNNKIDIRKGDYAPHLSDTTLWVGNIQKAMDVFNWYPRWLLRDGLKKTIEWVKHDLGRYSSISK